MIPVSLTIQGLYSYREKQSIDFEKLISGKLFGIFGATGSGKSSVLEAISFVLFDESERLNSRDSRAYNMMNLSSNQMMIDFTFKAGPDLQSYRFTYTAKRNSKKFDAISSTERRKMKWIDGNWIPDEKLQAHEILGLSYDNFRRAVIIPQGKFSEFLQLTGKERSDMLKEIFNLQKFDLLGKSASIEKRNDLNISSLEGEMSGIGIPEPQIIEEKKIEVIKIQEDLNQVQGKLIAHRTEKEKLLLLESDFKQWSNANSKLELLKSQEAEILQIENGINQKEKCEILFKPLFQKRSEILADFSKNKEALEQINSENENIILQLPAAEKTYLQLKTDFDNLDVDKNTLRALALILEIKLGEKQISQIVIHLEKEKNKQEEFKLQTDKIIANIQQFEDQIILLQHNLPSETFINESSEYYLLKQSNEQNQREIELEILKYQKDVETNTNAFVGWIQSNLGDVLRVSVHANNLEPCCETIAKKIPEFEEHGTQLQNELDHLKLNEKLSVFASEIEEGKPCPLCGSLEHPQILSEEFSEEKMNTLNRKFKENQALIQLCKTAGEHLERFQIKKRELFENSELKNEKLNQLKSDLNLLDYKYLQFENFPTTAQKALELKELRKNTLIKIQEIDQKLNHERNTQSQLQTQIDENQQSFQKLQIEMETALGIINSKKVAAGTELLQNLQKTELELEDLSRKLQTKIDSILIETPKAEAFFGNLKTRAEVLKGILKEKESLQNDYQAKLELVHKQIRDILIESEFSSETEVEIILNNSLVLSTEKAKCESFRKELHSAINTVNELKIRIEGKEFSEELLKQLNTKITEIQAEGDLLLKNLAVLKDEIKNAEISLERYGELQNNLNKLLLRREDLKTLRKMFDKSGFVNFVSSVYLRQLCFSANERFTKLSKQKLKLEVSDNNSLEIRDFLNEGKLRSAKTLSGGQTFQASLSLALALADSIASLQTSKQNFFFLDEGFGSQDKESLQEVFETLKSLRKENRYVGIISHVEELQQEIEMFIKTEMSEENGSLITASWELI